MPQVFRYWEAVQKDVCAHCIDSDGKGACRLGENAECALKRYFPDVVESVLSVRSDMLGPYESALRENVCSICDHQSKDSLCLVRSHIDCGLDRYFPLVVESIERLSVDRNGNLTDFPESR